MRMPVFEDLALIYDQAIDWEQRLARELPFLTKVIQDTPNARILDLACGSGRHAVALASQGYQVTGLDLSPQMIEAAKHHAKEKGVVVQFSIADMRQVTELLEGPFDLAPPFGRNYDVTSDGERFLMMMPSEPDSEPTQIHVVLNWFEELERLVPTN